MAALKSNAASNMQSAYKYNSGTPLEESFDVNYYETYFRNYDAQVGRFTGVDMLAEFTPDLTPSGASMQGLQSAVAYLCFGIINKICILFL